MKFISNFCSCLMWFLAILSVILVFVSNASFYSWIIVISLVIITALVSIHYDGKHDD